MLLLKTSKKNQGFTLAELVIVLFIAGLLASLSAPSFLSMNERNKVNAAVTSVEGALKEAQTGAMRKSKNCNITFSSTAITSSDGCLITGARKLQDVSLLSSLSTASPANSFNYNYKGITVDSSSNPQPLTNNITIVLLSNNNPKLVKCLVVSAPLGLIRTGTYNPSQVAFPAEQYCTP